MFDIHKLHLLTTWVVGTFTFHFTGGTVVERQVSLDDAKTVRAMLAGTRSGDALPWHSLDWLQFEETRVDFSSFEVSEDAGWGLAPDERDALTAAGHPHGTLRTLVDYWAGRELGEPAYSSVALRELHRAGGGGHESRRVVRIRAPRGR